MNVAGSLGTEISEPLNPLDGALDPGAQDSAPSSSPILLLQGQEGS